MKLEQLGFRRLRIAYCRRCRRPYRERWGHRCVWRGRCNGPESRKRECRCCLGSSPVSASRLCWRSWRCRWTPPAPPFLVPPVRTVFPFFEFEFDSIRWWIDEAEKGKVKRVVDVDSVVWIRLSTTSIQCSYSFFFIAACRFLLAFFFLFFAPSFVLCCSVLLLYHCFYCFHTDYCLLF